MKGGGAMKQRSLAWLAAGLGLLPSCAHVKVDPIEVKPIHIVMDVNVRVDRQLDEFFAFEDKYPAAKTPPAAQQ